MKILGVPQKIDNIGALRLVFMINSLGDPKILRQVLKVRSKAFLRDACIQPTYKVLNRYKVAIYGEDYRQSNRRNA